MSRLNYLLGVAGLTVCLSSATFSQTFNVQKPAKNSGPFAASPLPVVTPENFTSGVAKLGEETQNNLDQKLNASLKPLSVEAPKPPPASVTAAAPPSATTGPSTQKEDKTSVSKPAAKTDETPDAGPSAQALPSTEEELPPPAGSTSSSSSSAEGPANTPYTGFGQSSGPANSNSGASPSSGNGLNIKY